MAVIDIDFFCTKCDQIFFYRLHGYKYSTRVNVLSYTLYLSNYDYIKDLWHNNLPLVTRAHCCNAHLGR